LEAREATGLVSGGLQSAAGLGSVTLQSPRKSNSETSTLCREREEQRRILADTHSTAMDLRCRLDHNERDWLREKAELLQRFDVERREWECQLKDMQKKIEELYCEVRSSRGGVTLDSMRPDDNAVHRLSMHSTSTGSSLLSDNSRNQSETLCSSERHGKRFLQVEEASCDLGQIYDDLQALQRENWITMSPETTWRVNRSSSDTWMANTADPYRYRDTETSPGGYSDMEAAAPPIPPRTSSWNVSSSNPDAEIHIAESPLPTVRKCHSPCVLLDRKCNSPSIVRKFEAMLQENEGKVFKDGVLTSCSIPSSSNCNTGCCHNRWSCDASKLIPNKLSTDGTVQKSFSEVNILTAGKDLCPEKNSDAGKLQTFPVIHEFPVDSVSQEIQSVMPSLKGSRRNLMLERKTAEFNRTLFQAEMGRGVDVQDHYTGSKTCSEACKPVLATSGHILPTKDTTSPSICSDGSTNITDSYPDVSLSPSISTSTIQNPKVEQVQMRCTTKVQEFRKKPETPSDLSLEEPQAGLMEAPKPSQSSEVKYKLRKAGSFSKKSQQSTTAEPLCSAVTQPDESVESSNSKRENSDDVRPQTTRASVSPVQLAAESKKRQVTQPRQRSSSPYQSDSCRPVPRIMNEHPWKPLTLAAYPRPEGSRSNYGAVERILKNYESAARAQQNEMVSNPTELDMLDMAPLPLGPTLRHIQTSPTTQIHSPTAQVSLHGVKEVQLTVQGPALVGMLFISGMC
ncbi:hypothetical protein GOODEAATRI_020301, partial [Goodea atripinnis]